MPGRRVPVDWLYAAPNFLGVVRFERLLQQSKKVMLTQLQWC
jgi:hypothetical protein